MTEGRDDARQPSPARADASPADGAPVARSHAAPTPWPSAPQRRAAGAGRVGGAFALGAVTGLLAWPMLHALQGFVGGDADARLLHAAALAMMVAILAVAVAAAWPFARGWRPARMATLAAGTVLLALCALFVFIVSFQGNGPCCARDGDPPAVEGARIGVATCEGPHVRASVPRLHARGGMVDVDVRFEEVAGQAWWPEALRVHTANDTYEAFANDDSWAVLPAHDEHLARYRDVLPREEAWLAFSVLYIAKDGPVRGAFQMRCDIGADGLPAARIVP